MPAGLIKLLQASWSGKSIARIMMNLAISEKVRLKGRVLDLACGVYPSYYNFFGHPEREKLIRLDISPKANPSIAASLESPLPFRSGVIDTVLLFNAFYLVKRHGELVAEIHRILRRSGSFFLYVPFLWSPHPEPHDYYRYTGELLHPLMVQAGFTRIRVSAFGGYFLAVLNLGYELFRYRFIRLLLLVPAFFLDKMLAKIIKNYADRFPMGYFVSCRKK